VTRDEAGADREIFLSVECGAIDQAARSLDFLKKLLS